MEKYTVLSEEEQMRLVEKDVQNILKIDKPSEQVQIEAVRKNVQALEYIKNPTERVKKKQKNRKHSHKIFCVQ